MKQQQLRKVLDAAVANSTNGHSSSARPGQAELTVDIAMAMSSYSQHAAQAPTGSGKSLAALVPAMLLAARGAKTVVSTKTIALQDQILKKDGPGGCAAVMSATHYMPRIELLKGWHNYGCTREAIIVLTDKDDRYDEGTKKAAVWVLKQVKQLQQGKLAPRGLGDKDNCTPLKQLMDNGAAHHQVESTWDNVAVHKHDCPGASGCKYNKRCLPAAARELAASADIIVVNHALLAEQAAKNIPVVIGTELFGNIDHLVIDEAHELPGCVRDSSEVNISGRTIKSIVTTVRSCLGSSHEIISRGEQLANRLDAAISALAARKDLSVQPRGQYRVETDLLKDFSALTDVKQALKQWALDGQEAISAFIAKDRQTKDTFVIRLKLLGDAVRDETATTDIGRYALKWLSGTYDVLRSTDENSCFGLSTMLKLLNELEGTLNKKATRDEIKQWVLKMQTAITGLQLNLQSTSYKADRRLGNIETYFAPGEDSNYAKWLSVNKPLDQPPYRFSGIEIVAKPIETGELISKGLYNYKRLNSKQTSCEGSNNETLLSVVVLSATLPGSVLPDLGITVERKVYPSPFMNAYKRSLLYTPTPNLPMLSPPILWVGTNTGGRRPKFDIRQHVQWAVEIICRLVDANGGSALVLSATTEASAFYATKLRSCANGRFAVYWQKDGAAGAIANMWNEDKGSVLVGTRTYTTGLDAPGDTCTLVIVDRPPRAIRNPLDDARAQKLVERTKISKYSADVQVYVADAALLLEQSVGRLVRKEDDSGLVAVLDPRLTDCMISYGTEARNKYDEATRYFISRTDDYAEALQYLKDRGQLLTAS